MILLQKKDNCKRFWSYSIFIKWLAITKIIKRSKLVLYNFNNRDFNKILTYSISCEHYGSI